MVTKKELGAKYSSPKVAKCKTYIGVTFIGKQNQGFRTGILGFDNHRMSHYCCICGESSLVPVLALVTVVATTSSISLAIPRTRSRIPLTNSRWERRSSSSEEECIGGKFMARLIVSDVRVVADQSAFVPARGDTEEAHTRALLLLVAVGDGMMLSYRMVKL